MKVKKYILSKIFIYLTFLMATFPLLTFGARSILTITWSLFGIFFFFKRGKYKTKLDSDILWFIIPFFSLILSLIYSDNINYGINSLIKMISFIVIPFIIFLNKNILNKKNSNKVLYVFSISVVILVFYQIINIIFNLDFILQNLTIQEIKANGYQSISQIDEVSISRIKLRRFRNYVISISNTHTTYQGLWASFVIFFLGSKFNKVRIKVYKGLILVTIITLIFWIYFISARMPLIALLISSVLVIIFFTKYSKGKLYRISLIFVIITILSFTFKNPFSIRLKEYFNTGLTMLEKKSKTKDFNSSNVRNGIYYCDLWLIEKHPFFGVGIGDIQDELNNCYNKKIGAKVYKWHQYNTHNQYVFFWLSSGFIGLLLFLSHLIMFFKKAFRNNNYLLFYFSCITTLIFMTENLLERSDGVIFYSFFGAILLVTQTQKTNSNNRSSFIIKRK